MPVQETLLAAIEKFQAGQLPEAERLCRQVLDLRSDYSDALHLLGLILSRAGKLREAVELIQRAIGIEPKQADYWINLGSILDSLGNSEGAVAAYGQAIALRPDSAEARNNLANALAAMGKYDEAISELQQAVALRRDYPDALYNLANIYQSLGRREEAVECFQRSIALRPTYGPAHNNLGMSLSGLSRYDEAIAAYRKALALCPDQAGIHLNLGAAHHSKGEMDAAIACYEDALRLSPGSASALNNLGNAMKDSGRIERAVEYYQRASEIAPDSVALHNNRVYSLTMHPDYSGQEILRELRVWEQRHARPLKARIRPHANNRDAERKLRIGYVSADFRDHVVGRNILPLLRDRDREGYEVFCYSSVAKPDGLTERYLKLADAWRDIVAIDDDRAAEIVRNDGIDILVDLSVHTGGNRLLLFARRPAPVQATFAGYPGSTGLSTMDWRLTDPYLDPPDKKFDEDYAERSYRLPHSFWCYDPEAMEWEQASAGPQPGVGPLPALQNGFITFGCLNNHAKVNDQVLHLWGAVMASAKNSRLLVTAPYGWSRRRVVQILADYGVSSERIDFVVYEPRRDYLVEFNRIDLGLDTFPYNGHTASLDALWMGVPAITRVGRTVVGRAGWSQLSNLGLRELAAHSDEEFAKIAAEMCSNLPRLAELRRTLRSRMLASPLCDGRRFTRGIEAAFRAMWGEWCARPVE